MKKLESQVNMRSLILLALCSLPVLAFADLSGTWRCDDGGTYYIRQVGNSIYMFGERAAENPQWSNVYRGKVAGDMVTGNWMDVPKGRTSNTGSLTLKIASDNTLSVVQKTGGFGGSKWTRDTNMERNINRPGQDLRSLDLGKPDPNLCKNACVQEQRCVAWTYVNPGVQGPKPKCWLKGKVPAPRFETCCVSGVVDKRVAVSPERLRMLEADAERLRRLQPRGEGEPEPPGAPERP